LSLNFKRIIVAGLSFIFLIALLMVAWVEGLKERVERDPEPALLGVSKDCYECHVEKSPGVTDQWAMSTHAEKGVGCYDCHGAEEGDIDAWHHEGHRIATLVTPKDCGECHPDIATEFQSSHHAAAGNILGSLDNVLGEIIEGVPAANSGCQQCHGSQIAFEMDAAGEIVHDDDGKPVIVDATWPNSGIGRLNPDGSNGNCAACHSRHTFSLEMARRPDNCGKCHLGPDHPQKEIYDESKHGIAFVTADQQGHMNMADKEWVVGEDYSAAPTCASCHMSATSNMVATHDPGNRISWTLRPAISKKQEDWEDKRQNMKDVCLNCHTQDWVNGHYAQYDRVVDLYNGKFAEPSKRIMDVLLEEGLRTSTPFDEEIEWTYFYLWHHEGRRARMGASMMGPDYTQWHGFFEIAERFYIELLPQAEELAHGNANAEQVIEEVRAMEQHTWAQGLSPEESARIRAFYDKRYGQGAGDAAEGAH
jgi:hydroxylamine dehydrogenase